MLQEHKLKGILTTITGKSIEVSQMKSGVDDPGVAEIDSVIYRLLDLLLDAGYSIKLTQPNLTEVN
jgi:hypothetical protein